MSGCPSRLLSGMMLITCIFAGAVIASANAPVPIGVQHGQITGNDNNQISFKVAYLPAWLNTLSGGEDPGCLTVIGISDPGIATSMAEAQAMHRATMIGALLTQATVNFNHELFSIFQEQNKDHATNMVRFARFNSLNSSPHISGSISILDSTTTVYGEKIICACFKPLKHDETSPPLTTQLDFMHIEYGKTSDFSDDKFFKLQAYNQFGNSQYTVHQTGHIAELNSGFNGNNLPFQFGYFKYLPHEKPNKPPKAQTTARLYYGLWRAFIEAFSLNISSYYQNQQTMHSNVQEAYQQQFQTMSAESAQTIISGKINGIAVGNNELYLNMNISDVQPLDYPLTISPTR